MVLPSPSLQLTDDEVQANDEDYDHKVMLCSVFPLHPEIGSVWIGKNI